MMKGLIIGGEFGKLFIRQKSTDPLELGEILVCEAGSLRILLEVFDLVHASQVSSQQMELISGMQLEEATTFSIHEPELNYYSLAHAKSLVVLNSAQIKSAKVLPPQFSSVRAVTLEDLSFITVPQDPLFFGNLRSGSKVLPIEISLSGPDVLTHHLLISATTGKGKSNLTSCLLWSSAFHAYAGLLVLDPHDEYYGRLGVGLKDHPAKRVVYYTPHAPPPGAKTLCIHLKTLRPHHFQGVLDLSDPQQQALYAYYREYGEEWISALLLERPLAVEFHVGTLAVLKRRFLSLLDLRIENGQLLSQGIFDLHAGQTLVSDIAQELESSKIVILDTSSFSGALELLIGSLISSEIFNRYKYHKTQGLLGQKPVIGIVLEEAPRVLGKDVLERGQNIFATIAREGRKFKVGLVAITQLPSLIPRDILANMNTKIILGTEMASERAAIIDSAAQDLSMHDRTIASLDKGEALITSTFSRFALPVSIPRFSDLVSKTRKDSQPARQFVGVSLI